MEQIDFSNKPKVVDLTSKQVNHTKSMTTYLLLVNMYSEHRCTYIEYIYARSPQPASCWPTTRREVPPSLRWPILPADDPPAAVGLTASAGTPCAAALPPARSSEEVLKNEREAEQLRLEYLQKLSALQLPADNPQAKWANGAKEALPS